MKKHGTCSVYSGLVIIAYLATSIFISQPALGQSHKPVPASKIRIGEDNSNTEFPTASLPDVNPPKEKALPPPRNLKVISEESDGKGNIVRVIQYDQGVMRVTETTIMPKTIGINNTSVVIRPDTMIKDFVRLVVDKTKHSLEVYYRKRMIRAYKATFGPNPLQNKCMEGDRCTPEGTFKITSKNPASRYNKFMLLNYPNDSTMARFRKLKEAGVLPSTARIGGDIGIHGIWPGGDNMIELGVGWTDGCVALKNKDVEELFSMVGVGTTVFIKK